MFILEELRRESNNLQDVVDNARRNLSQLIEFHKELDPDPEFDEIFDLKKAEINHCIDVAEDRMKHLNNMIEEMLSQDRVI